MSHVVIALVRFVSAAIAITNVSCVHHPMYPKTWTPLRSSIGTDCSGLSGTFDARSRGYSATEYSAPNLPWQIHWLVFGSKYDPITWDSNKPTSVRLIVAAPKVTATFLDGSEIMRTLEIGAPVMSASCDGHELKLRRAFGDATLFSFFGGSEDTWFLRDNEGSLIVRTGSTSGGLGMLVVPVVDSHFEWVRYPQVPGEDNHSR
jgi:hypothetical protein